MLVRTWLVPVVVLAAGCGPEAVFVPRTGVYDVMVEILDNDCSSEFAERPEIDAIVFADDELQVGIPDFLTASGLSSVIYAELEREAGNRFLAKPGKSFDTWVTQDGCRYRRAIMVELLADDVVQTRATYEWADAGGCEWLEEEQAGCAMIRETTATLREVCEGCDLDEARARARAIYAEEHPQEK
ncbi:MAG: hypothetical protein JNK56_03290 [Myxococcales bacterium]|nr:hypothetical protein [Myxococcales bacterium]